MSWFINDLKAYDYDDIRDIVEKENLRGELKLYCVANPDFNLFTYTLSAAPRILPQVVERLDDETESGAAVAQDVLRDVFFAGASNPDSRPPSASFGEL